MPILEIGGIIFGGLARLGQHWMELKDKEKERAHEAVMFDKQVALQNQRHVADRELRQMDVDSAKDTAELNALITAIADQTAQAGKAGGWVLKLSASVRPIVSYWLLALYSISKFVALYLAASSGLGLGEMIKTVYTEFDAALLGSIMAYWFADRSLRKAQ